MAYELYYTAHFTNEQSQSVEIFIYKKDADPPDTVEVYEVSEDNGRCNLTDNGEDQTKYNCIIVRELSLSLWTTDDKSLTWETFIDTEHDTWKIEVIIDTQKYFEGFITPDEGNGPFQDKPYDVNILATNSLALLKGTELSDVNGDPFDTDHTLIEYIAGALKKTGLDLPIRIYCGYFHLSMQNKGDSLDNDMFQQTDLNYRTFQKDPTTFVSCYDALKIILDKFCTLEYWNGMWVIASIAEKQYISDTRYYVDYDSDGAVIAGAIDTHDHGRIGKQMELYPINENQEISSRFAVKSVATRFPYNTWPEIPKNNKFDRGTEFENGVALDEDDIDNDGDTSEVIGTYKKFTIPDWEFGKLTSAAPANFPFVLGPPDGAAYVKRVYNTFGVEIIRKVVIEKPSTGLHWLRSEPIPVKKDSKIKIGLQGKFPANFVSGGPTSRILALVYVVDDSGTQFWGLNTVSLDGTIPAGGWEFNGVGTLAVIYSVNQDSSDYTGFSFTSLAIPSDGNLYIVLQHSSVFVTGATVDLSDFTFEYLPFVAGGYVQVKGDYVQRIQSANFPDIIDEEVSISDSPQKAVKGALLFNNQLTDPAWYRHGPVSDPNVLDETRHFKELLNLARFNHSYRRMYALEGDFNGLNYAPENDPTNKLPIGFFWMYREVDMTTPRDFVLVPPLKMDIMRGWITANLVEVKKDNNDGTQEGTAEFKYIF